MSIAQYMFAISLVCSRAIILAGTMEEGVPTCPTKWMRKGGKTSACKGMVPTNEHDLQHTCWELLTACRPPSL